MKASCMPWTRPKKNKKKEAAAVQLAKSFFGGNNNPTTTTKESADEPSSSKSIVMELRIRSFWGRLRTRSRRHAQNDVHGCEFACDATKPKPKHQPRRSVGDDAFHPASFRNPLRMLSNRRKTVKKKKKAKKPFAVESFTEMKAVCSDNSPLKNMVYRPAMKRGTTDSTVYSVISDILSSANNSEESDTASLSPPSHKSVLSTATPLHLFLSDLSLLEDDESVRQSRGIVFVSPGENSAGRNRRSRSASSTAAAARDDRSSPAPGGPLPAHYLAAAWTEFESSDDTESISGFLSTAARPRRSSPLSTVRADTLTRTRTEV